MEVRQAEDKDREVHLLACSRLRRLRPQLLSPELLQHQMGVPRPLEVEEVGLRLRLPAQPPPAAAHLEEPRPTPQEHHQPGLLLTSRAGWASDKALA